MKMTISERDKRLLYLLVCALTLLLFVRFGILPAIERAGVLEEELGTAEQTKAEMELQIATLNTLDLQIENARKQLADKNAKFYTKMTNDELDDLITGIVLQQNLSAVSMRIIEAKAEPVTAYFASMLAQTQAAAGTEQPTVTDTSAAQTAQAGNADTGTAQLPYVPPIATNADNYIYTAVVECTVDGARADFISLLDAIESSYPAIRVQRFSFTDTAYLTQTMNVETLTQFTVTFHVFMCDKAGDAL